MTQSLKLIGYWRGHPLGWQCGYHRFPHPSWVADCRLPDEERAKLVAYLQSGAYADGMMGLSYCRFCCGPGWDNLGASELSDGEWTWPVGLAHYVERHRVRLPDEFMATVRANDFRIPASAERVLSERPVERPVSTRLWVEWGRRQRPWYIPW